MATREYVTHASYDATMDQFAFETDSGDVYLHFGLLNSRGSRLANSLIEGSQIGFFQDDDEVARVEVEARFESSRIQVSAVPSALTVGQSYTIKFTQADPGADNAPVITVDQWNALITALGNLATRLGTFIQGKLEDYGEAFTSALKSKLEGIVEGTWTPDVTNVPQGRTVTVQDATYKRVEDRFDFGMKFVAGGGTDEWALMSPRFSLPVALGQGQSVDAMTGFGGGYGGSEMKFFETLFRSTVTDEGSLSGGINNISSATVHNGTVYIGRDGSGLIYTLNPSTLVWTQYVDTGNQAWRSLVSHNGVLYGWDNYRLSSITSSGATAIGNNQAGINIQAMASVGGVLYGMDGSGRLYSINTTDSTTTLIGTATGSQIFTMFGLDGKLYGIDEVSPYEVYLINTSDASLTEVVRFDTGGRASFVYNSKLYLIRHVSNPAVRSIDLNVPPLTSVDFHGPTYTTAIAHVQANNDLIEVPLEKLQKNNSSVLIQVAGSYRFA